MGEQRSAAGKASAKSDTVTVQLEGELDHCSAERVRAALDALIADPAVKRLVVDVSRLTFMDSSGVGVIIGRYRTLARRQGSLAVRGASTAVDRIFRMSGLYQIVEKCR
ncbi:MAG: anti-sigma factor antagonist [Oscillospiraceae bacterium]|jgi:stage II sporulation protein AA (anti-sigma F factor antagonist)|nr:anti-sigma factor antagonist [Oscillospiraceae bacterium]